MLCPLENTGGFVINIYSNVWSTLAGTGELETTYFKVPATFLMHSLKFGESQHEIWKTCFHCACRSFASHESTFVGAFGFSMMVKM
jgi:hypothetical protein